MCAYSIELNVFRLTLMINNANYSEYAYNENRMYLGLEYF